MAGHTCYHCKQWVPEGEAHDCWTTTEGALTRDLPEDLREAWERLREAVGDHGEQRIYASHNSIMFARKACYAFVRPKTSRLEVCVFLGRTVQAPQVKSATAVSRVKVAHLVHVRHRDEVEPPLTDWLREAYEVSDELGARARAAATTSRKTPSPRRKKAAEKPARKVTRKAGQGGAKKTAKKPAKRVARPRR